MLDRLPDVSRLLKTFCKCNCFATRACAGFAAISPEEMFVGVARLVRGLDLGNGAYPQEREPSPEPLSAD